MGIKRAEVREAKTKKGEKRNENRGRKGQEDRGSTLAFLFSNFKRCNECDIMRHSGIQNHIIDTLLTNMIQITEKCPHMSGAHIK